MSVTLSTDGRTLTVRVPITIQKRGGRKLVVVPDTAGWAPEVPQVENALVKALAKAYRWRRMLETGVHSTLGEIAAAEKVNPSYVSRVLRLTLLAPHIVAGILDARQGAEVTLNRLLRPFPIEWEKQYTQLTRQ